MKDAQLIYRKQVLFAASLEGFHKAREEFFSKVSAFATEGDKKTAVQWASDMFIDAQSFLTEWKLDRWIDPAEKEALISRCREVIETYGTAEDLEKAVVEVKDICQCKLAEAARATLAGKLNIYWGHDKCDEIDYSLRRGASFTTSNPGKVNGYRKDYPEEWNKLVAEAKAEYGDADAVKLLSVLTMKVVAMMARHTAPIFEATDGQYGFSSIQVSPKNWNNASAMEEEICFWYEVLRKELKTDTPNVTFKVPATPAAVVAAQNVGRKYARIRLCATSNFATRQHVEFYEALKGRDPAGLLVIVDVHLRTYSRPEFEALGVADPDRYCELLVSMIYRKCYALLREQGLNLQLNGAGIRDAQGVRNNFTTDMALPVTFTIMPAVVKDFDANPKPLVDAMHDEISEEDMAILNQSKIFRQAYYQDEFPWDDIRSFPPYCLMMDKFEEAYDACIDALGG